tara:strand:- start:13745 stop:15151 length:1407 start_codon:yes stop_codon:yes gene_type:complete
MKTKTLLNLLIIIPFLSFAQCDENENFISISSTTGEWAYEMAWALWDYNTWMEIGPEEENALASFIGNNNYETISFEACLPSDGCYIIGGYDSYGDGWNDGYIVVNVNNSKSPDTYELTEGTWGFWTFEVNTDPCEWEIPGCTNPEAENYNELATIDNGSCIVPLLFDWDKEQREYFLYVPEILPENAPLVFVLHGYWGTGSDMIGILQEQADTHGFVICYPNGLEDNFGTNHWNANFNESMTTVDDLGFLTNLAVSLQEEYNLSPNKTFSCGMSNGGYMSWSLACNAPETFKAIASVTGTMSGPDWQECNPSTLIPVMQISGTNDDVVPMDGSMQYVEEGWGGAPDIYTIMDYWSDLHGCSQNETNNFGFDYSTDVTQYFQCISNTSFELRLYVANGMGHTWPQFANEQIWDFFMQIAAWPLDVDEFENETKSLIKTIDMLGRDTHDKGFNAKIFNDGTVEKIYQIK